MGMTLNLSRIVEAPVTDIGLLGDFAKPGGFTKRADKALVAGPGRLEAIQQAWGKTDHDFRLYFAQFRGGRNYAEQGIAKPEQLADIEQRLGKPLPKAVPDAITVIFTNNSGDEWRPMTPWIIAHRLGHALWRGRLQDKRIGQDAKDLEEVITRYLDQLSDAHGLEDRHFQTSRRPAETYSLYGNTQIKDRRRLASAHAYGTMRSARQGDLRNVSEFTFETLAQYLLTGKVALNDKPQMIVTHHAWGKPQGSTTRDAGEVETLSRDFGYEVPQYIDNLLEAAKGKIYLM